MKNFWFAIVLIAALPVSCAKSTFNGAAQKTAETPSSDEPSTQSQSDLEPQGEPQKTADVPPPAEEKNITPSEDSAMDTALEPVMVGGAFLVCVQSVQVECRLDSATARNINPPAGLKIEFSSNNVPLTFTNATVQGFRWRLNNFTPNGALRILQLRISSASKEWIYHTEFEIQALQIGDGTNALQGCTQAFVQQSKLVGLKYEQTYTVSAGMTDIMIHITGLCGIARANDSMIQLLDSAGVEVFKQFFPITQAATSFNYKIQGLKAGAYSVRVTPGDDIDIDDLFINSLAISSIGL